MRLRIKEFFKNLKNKILMWVRKKCLAMKVKFKMLLRKIKRKILIWALRNWRLRVRNTSFYKRKRASIRFYLVIGLPIAIFDIILCYLTCFGTVVYLEVIILLFVWKHRGKW